MNEHKKAAQKRVSISWPIIILVAGLFIALAFAAFSIWDSVEELPEQASAETQSELVAEDDLYVMTAEDCTSFEQFDPVAEECFYECDTDEECEAIEAQIDAELDALFGEELGEFQEGERPADTSGLNQIEVSDGELVDNGLVSDRDREVWGLFTQVAPRAMLENEIMAYETYDDPNDGTAAYVAPDEQNATVWILGVNHSAMYIDGVLDRPEAIRTMIHEMAHILTLGDTQVPAGSFGGSCGTIELQEGCANEGSYIAAFNERFWESIRGVWPGADASEDAIFDFYEANQDQFVSDYAATNLGEDIAESFTSFVVQPIPSGTEIRDQKVRFFEDYPELVRLRNTIRQNIAL